MQNFEFVQLKMYAFLNLILSIKYSDQISFKRILKANLSENLDFAGSSLRFSGNDIYKQNLATQL